MKQMYKLLPAALTILALVMPSCVKEDRRECPCYLTEVFERLPEGMRKPNSGLWLQVRSQDGAIVKQETVSPADYPAPDWLLVKVPKGYVSVAAANGRAHYRTSEDGRTLMLSSGVEADSLWAHASRVDCRDESAVDTVILHKQWCTLTIKLEGVEVWKPYKFQVTGGWCGMDTGDLSAVAGEFSAYPRRIATDRYEVRIPRQADNNLRLKLYEDGEDEPVYDYPMGQLMYGSGYDWYRRDLDDLMVTVDYARAEVTVNIAPWDRGQEFGEIVI